MRIVAIDTETVHDEPWSVQWSTRPGEGRMTLAIDRHLLRTVGETLESSSTLTVVHNAMFDVPVLAKLGIHPAHVADTMIMAYLLRENSLGLKTLAYRHCDMELHSYKEMVRDASREKATDYLERVVSRDWPDPRPILEIRPDGEEHIKFPQNVKTKVVRLLKKTEADPDLDLRDKWNAMDGTSEVTVAMGVMEPGYLSDIPLDDAVQYACMDADATGRLYSILWPRIQSNGLEDVFWSDMGVHPMVVDMMEAGMLIDRQHFENLEVEYDARCREIMEEVGELNGGYLNPTSPKAVLEALRARGVDVVDTSAEELDRHREDPLVRLVQDYRGYAKLNNTYVRVIPQLADGDGRVHTTLSLVRTATGRLASSNPNLQSQPVRTEDGRRIR